MESDSMGRTRKMKKSYVISMRISTEERAAMQEVMALQNIGRVSDLMRRAMEIVKLMPENATMIRRRAARSAR